MNKFYNAIKNREPAATAGVIQALLIFLVKLGVLNLTLELMNDIQLALIAILSYWIRGQVVSNAEHSNVVNILDAKIETALQLPQDSNRDDLEESHKARAA